MSEPTTYHIDLFTERSIVPKKNNNNNNNTNTVCAVWKDPSG